MATLDERTRQALRATVPFDPTRLSNWHGAIGRALTSGERRSAPIESLVDRTLKVQGILTRAKRRQFVVRQIMKAIRQLCQQGILHEYSPGKVKLLHADESDRVKRLIAKQPVPWADESIGSENEVDGETAAEAAQLGDLNDDDDGADEALPSRPITLPLLSITDGARAQPLLDSEETESPLLHGQDESRALDSLLGVSQGADLNERTPSHAILSAVPASLAGVAACLTTHDRHLVFRTTGRTTLAGETNGCVISMEQRRDNSIRVAVRFSADALPAVLKMIGILWHDAPVGTDQTGRPSLYRSWPASTDGKDIAQRIVDDLQFIEDAVSSTQG